MSSVHVSSVSVSSVRVSRYTAARLLLTRVSGDDVALEDVMETAAEVLGEEVVEAVISNTENLHQQDIEAAIQKRRGGL